MPRHFVTSCSVLKAMRNPEHRQRRTHYTQGSSHVNNCGFSHEKAEGREKMCLSAEKECTEFPIQHKYPSGTKAEINIFPGGDK